MKLKEKAFRFRRAKENFKTICERIADQKKNILQYNTK